MGLKVQAFLHAKYKGTHFTDWNKVEQALRTLLTVKFEWSSNLMAFRPEAEVQPPPLICRVHISVMRGRC